MALPRKPAGNLSEIHREAIEGALFLQALLLADIQQEFGMDLDTENLEDSMLDLTAITNRDRIDLLEQAETDPELKARLDAVWSPQLGALVSQALQPQAPEEGQ